MSDFLSRRIEAVKTTAGVDRKVTFHVDDDTGEGAAAIERAPMAAATAALVGGAERAFADVAKLDLSKLGVLHEDGGVQAFADESAGVDDDDLLAAYQSRRQGARAQFGIAFGAALIALLMVIWDEYLVGFSLVLIGFVFGFASYISIYRAWQISERRMGSLREFQQAGEFWLILTA